MFDIPDGIKNNDSTIIQNEYEKLFIMISDYYNKYLDYPTIRHDTQILKKCEKHNAIDANVVHIT
jgi:hypothetical protein